MIQTRSVRDLMNNDSYLFLMKELEKVDEKILEPLSGTDWMHHSRVLRFTGRELPRRESQRESYWGASELEHILEELRKHSGASANIAQLIFQANITTLKISDFGDTLAMGTEEQKMQIREAIHEENRFRTSFGLQVLSAGDTMENHPYSFGGLAEI